MKNNKSEKEKNIRGFYVALGISALMIGSACYFSYKEGDSKYSELSDPPSLSSDYAVDHKKTDIPKVTTTTRRGSSYLIVTTTDNSPEITSPVLSSAPESVTVTETSETVVQETEVICEVTAETSVTEIQPETEQENSEVPEVLNQPLESPLTVINDFSGQELVKNATTGSWQTHNGTDYKAEIGDNVYSVTNGIITAVNNDPLWGTVVVIQAENGDIYRYCNLSKELNVQQGTEISAGNVIGSVGDTADIESALEPHLHIEIMRGGKYENPVDFIKSE